MQDRYQTCKGAIHNPAKLTSMWLVSSPMAQATDDGDAIMVQATDADATDEAAADDATTAVEVS